MDLVVDDLWCLASGRKTALTTAELVLEVIGFFNECEFDGVKLRPFQFYVDNLRQRAESMNE